MTGDLSRGGSGLDLGGGDVLEPFERRGLLCLRRQVDIMDSSPRYAWASIGRYGALVFIVGPCLAPLEPMAAQLGYQFAGGQWWMAWDIGGHSLTPRYDGESTFGECEWLGGRPCYYDGSGLQAIAVLQRVVESHDESVLWDELYDYYQAWLVPAIEGGQP